ncbi:zinc chelation protein SecC [Pseudomonas chlororaphis]|uniref:zinc chelation protein SecC n=1 Tax=Pseudomonas chlororaphis TaxID=587753 RepID=UPI0018E9F4FA|nr:zinc chelation protein SecC [Pseudomonas chlororaphis]
MKFNLLTFEDAQNPDIPWILNELDKEKKLAVLHGNEERANDCWRESEALQIALLYIEAFQKIKNREYREGWYSLERCEIKCKFLQENSSEEFCLKKRVFFISDRISALQSLYPYSVFSSPGFTVGYYTCSICNHKIRPRSRCAHVKGKIYSGELCLHRGHDLEFKEISIVSKPVQKYSVVHDDRTLDFSILEYLMSALDDGFEGWDMIHTTMSFPIERFNRVEPNHECPCRSGAQFGVCCADKKEIEIPHIAFALETPPTQPLGIKFPY